MAKERPKQEIKKCIGFKAKKKTQAAVAIKVKLLGSRSTKRYSERVEIATNAKSSSQMLRGIPQLVSNYLKASQVDRVKIRIDSRNSINEVSISALLLNIYCLYIFHNRLSIRTRNGNKALYYDGICLQI